jgi:WD40 repeat protein
MLRAAERAKVDAYGDPLPDGAVARLGTVRWRHGDGTLFVAFLPGGKALLTVGRDETVRQWDVATGKELRRFRLPDENAGRLPAGQTPAMVRSRFPGRFGVPFFGVALSADGKTLAVSNPLLGVRLFDVATGKELHKISIAGRITTLAFAPDSKTLALQDATGLVRLCDVATAKELRQFAKPNRDDANSRGYLVRGPLAFSPDGNILVCSTSVSPNESVPLIWWNTATGKEIRRTAATTGRSGTGIAAFSPDGKYLAWNQGGAMIVLTDASNGRRVRMLVPGGDSGRIGGFLFTPDGKTLAAFDMVNGGMVLWDVESGKESRKLNVPTPLGPGGGRFLPFRAVAFSPDSKLLAVGGMNSAIRVLDVDSGKEVNAAGNQSPIAQVRYARDGKTVLAMDAERTLIAWDAVGGKERRRVPGAPDLNLVTLSGDGRHVISSDARGTISIVDALTGKESHTLKYVSPVADALTVSPDNKLAAFSILVDDATGTGNQTGLIALYDIAAGKERHRFEPPLRDNYDPDGVLTSIPLGTPTDFQFSPDGEMLIHRFDTNKLVLWNVVSGKEVSRVQTPGGLIQAYVFARDSRSLVVDYGAGLSVYETATGMERRRYGTLPATAEPIQEDPRTARLRALARARGLGGAHALALSPNGRLLAHSRPGGTIQLWDVATGKELGQLQGHQADVTALAFAADGKTLASGSGDTTILIWDLTPFAANAKPPAAAVNVEAAWKELMNKDATKAFDAICAFAAAPQEAVPFFKERLHPAAVNAEKVQRLIADLDDEQFTVRKRASNELEKLGELAGPSLRKALENGPSLEAERRMKELLTKLGGKVSQGEGLRSVRAIEALERIGTPEARQVLQALAKGAAGAVLTRAAQGALERLER